MFLKRLDIVGFKSFAERVSVEFVNGVTAVVGPNGSGKSNITDAIRWVLGEQSARSLRGAKMEDIIFAGSDSRKGVNIAEVTLTLDNREQFLPIDFNEVSISRRVYRSGESEYSINNQSCRLKDIIDLFMDSGLGKEAFSIISQGKVEEILSSKAEERRSIFEEAAGVLKYKTRKKKAEYKLAETQENLNRVQDILHELEGQIEPLKIQSSAAKDYLEKKAELEEVEAALIVYEIEEAHKYWEHLTQTVEAGKQKELLMLSDIGNKEGVLEETRDKVAALDESIDELQQVLLIVSEELEKLEGKKEVLKERKKNANSNKASLEKSIEDLGELNKRLQQEKSQEEKVFKALKNQVAELRKNLSSKQAEMKTYDANLEEKIEEMKNVYFDLLNEQVSKRNESSYLEEQLQQQDMKKNRLKNNNQRYLVERQELEHKKAGLSSKLETAGEQLAEHIQDFRSTQQKLERNRENYQKQESALYKAYQFLQQMRSRKEVLENMQEDYAGFFQGVKEILKARESLEGIHGAIAELVTMDKEYEAAIETALGGAAQHIVVENEECGRKSIAYLKKNAFGRATMLPMNVIKSRSIASHEYSSIKSHPAFIGVASELTNYNERYRNVIGNLLGAVIITKDLKGANELARLTGYKIRFVTLEGDVVNPGGSMTGGAVKQKNNSLLSRSRELEDVKSKLTDMESKTASLEDAVKSLKSSISLLEAKLDEMRTRGENLRMQEQSLQGEMRELLLSERNVNDHLSIYDAERASFQEDFEKASLRKEELAAELEDINLRILAGDREIQELTAKKNQQQTSRQELQQNITDIKVLLASKEQTLFNQRATVVRLADSEKEAAMKLSAASEDLAYINGEMTTSKSGEENLEEAAEQKQKDKSKTMELITSRREERLGLQASLDHQEAGLKEEKRLHRQTVNWLKDEELKLARVDVELDNLLQHLRQEYLLTFEAAKEKHSLKVQPDDARRSVKLIKLAIEELGTVNLGAIDEYDRVSERFNFLSEQREDLLLAKQTLYDVIGEMDEEMKKRFMTTFTQIRSHFESVFQAMFGGGRAELKLTDPSDILHTGVDIIAQPPGKKLQNLGLLSGGERALTAIALLFSILKVRPVPFCVLDEVEAALDEANVHRFAQYLKKFSKDTQFIVITHRKGTMEEADVLYGVTMQESGVSKLVSVRLEETKELIAT
ncbi:chromosome segregation protein SMC [Bacillus lacus]|uniref:Chromosome partition protein Smc n=1 Tax=Metabacillus lacus TaxID=1983721 RepID=A0A7X2LYD9_9BACI|nr:chromosome segregation protein SMC [Metabacillus lacus]MRX70564.1 chromosome segregation protein SMC [Metabacillus lacus]